MIQLDGNECNFLRKDAQMFNMMTGVDYCMVNVDSVHAVEMRLERIND